MSRVKIKFFCESDGTAPVKVWLEELKLKDKIGYARCVAKIKVLADMGLDARRPTVEYLRDGIFELRAKHVHIQYRILFFYQEQDAVILAHHLLKKSSKIPESDINVAIDRKRRFEADMKRHTYEQRSDD